MYDYYAYYDAQLDKSSAIRDFLRALQITGQSDILSGFDGYFSFPIAEAVPSGTIISFFDIPRQSKNDQLGELSLVVVGPPEIDYGSDLSQGRWQTRLEFHCTNLSPEDLKNFLNDMYQRIHGFSKEDLRRALRGE